MSEKAVRIWFQNRRAKLRKSERKGRSAHSGSIDSSRSNSVGTAERKQYSRFSINEKYCFIDCTSLSVGSWQRVRSGYYNEQLLKEGLFNLSPFTLNKVMLDFDLLVIVSKKNSEINYFFSSMSDTSRILFRIFYPIANILSCSLLDNNIEKECNELRVTLSHRPKFSVNFYNGVNSSSNQWSICDDFSEGQQVSSAHRDGGSYIPHVLVGTKDSICFLNDFILEQNQQHQGNYMMNDTNSSTGLEGGIEGGYEDEDRVNSQDQSKSNSDNDNMNDMNDMNGINDEFQFSNTHLGPIWNETNELKANGLSPLGQFDGHPVPERKPDLHANFHHNEIFSANTPDFVTASQTPNIISSLSGTTPLEGDRDMEQDTAPEPNRINTSPFQNINNQETFDAMPTDETFDFPLVNEYEVSEHSNIDSPVDTNIERFIDYNNYS
ncbi:Transcription factor [Yamadazyma tenuis]|nr:Transcription factor [Yamadazyma tenuis]